MHLPFMYFFSLPSRFPLYKELHLDLQSQPEGEMRRAEYSPAPRRGALMSGVVRWLQSLIMMTRSRRRRQGRRRSHRRRRPEAALARALMTMLMMLLDLRPGRGLGQTDSPRSRLTWIQIFVVFLLSCTYSFLLVVRILCTAAGRFLFPKLVFLKNDEMKQTYYLKKCLHP